MTDTILTHRDGPIVTVVLNRPEKLNALTKPMWQRLGEVISDLSTEDDVRCIVVRGAGDKAFAPGNDISEFENERANVEQARAYGAIMHRTLAAFAQCRHPLVAMIKGICVGGGLEIAAMCDLPGITYIRTTREATLSLYSQNEEFPIGGSKVVRSSPKVASKCTEIATVMMKNRTASRPGIRAAAKRVTTFASTMMA